jgi:hypothetical protein
MHLFGVPYYKRFTDFNGERRDSMWLLLNPPSHTLKNYRSTSTEIYLKAGEKNGGVKNTLSSVDLQDTTLSCVCDGLS